MQQRRKTKIEPQRRIHRHMRPRAQNNEHRERQEFWSIFKSAASKHASNSRRCTRLSNPTTHEADTSRQVSSRRRSNTNSTQSNSPHVTSTKDKLSSKTHFFCFLAYPRDSMWSKWSASRLRQRRNNEGMALDFPVLLPLPLGVHST